jgi:predicted nucleic acid-binding protein
MIVIDASVLVTALVDDGSDGRRARRRLRAERLGAPEVIDLEVVSALRRLAAADRLDVRRADQALVDLAALRVVRVAHRPLLSRCWELRHDLTIYDATYVALAELLDVPLITADGRLARSTAAHCRSELLR